MRSLKLTVAYDGTEFFGWQWQPERRTVQGVLEKAIHRVTGETLRVVASGRTDAGVHALGQAVSFETNSHLTAEVLQRALNANLPADVVVLAASDAPAGFNAIDDARSKRYRYVIHNHPWRDVFRRQYAWHIHYQLDVQRMHEAARCLQGRHDFKSFESSGSSRVSTVRTVYDVTVSRFCEGEGARIEIEVEADGFLYNMVRNVVGTLVDVGRGRRPASWITELLALRDRRQAGATAPPHGLYLVHVNFENDSEH